MIGNSALLENSLEVSVDWIAFTSMSIKTVEEMFDFLGYPAQDFQLLPKGSSGYMKVHSLKSYPVRIMSEGSEDMGVHVIISGSAIRDVLEHYQTTLMGPTPFGTDAMAVTEFGSTVMCEFLRNIHRIGSFTRLDLAIDDKGCKYFSVEDFLNYCENDAVVSKFRTRRNIEESTMSGDLLGHTLYLGSRQSEVMLRVYDKRLEQNRKITKEEDKIQYDWIRWEIELKDERADSAAALIYNMTPLGEVITGILNNYVRVIVHDDSNRSRCSTLPLWEKFINTVNKLRLFVSKVKKTIKEKRSWIIRSVMPTIAGVIIADGGSFDIITDNFADAVLRMNNHMKHLVSQENPGWEYDFGKYAESALSS